MKHAFYEKLSPGLFFILALIAAPISSTIQSIAIVGALVTMAIYKHKEWTHLKPLLLKPWYYSGALLVLLGLLGIFWTHAPLHDAWGIVGKYSKLLILPCIVVGFREKSRRIYGLNAFLLSMLFICGISWGKVLGLIHYHGEDPGFVFRNHIMTGYMMAIAAFISLLLATKSKGWLRVGYGFLFALFSEWVLFVGMGRTSYIVYFVLMAIFLWRTLSKKYIVLGLLLFGSTISLVYHQSTIMHQRAELAVKEWQAYHQHTSENTSVGFRLQFHTYAYTLFKRHPWLGNGTGGFSHAFKQEQPVPAWGPELFEPHSQYWLVAADWGVVGLGLLFAYFISLLLACYKNTETGTLALGLIVTFCLASTLDSLLLYSGTGYFFLLLTGLCLASPAKLARS